jgi:PAS domain S-box-containing protein
VSKPIFGFEPNELLGRSDDEVLSPASVALLVDGKREALAQGQPVDAELRIDRDADVFWYDFHIEPLRDSTGKVVGLTGAAVDITERKQHEAHLRLLMRELTHRSKNLLAVIQGMARQTARPAGTIENFLDRFGARLQALARSHDLLIQESWHGVSLDDLVRSQLGHYLDREKPQILVRGPQVQLKPEAAQSLGLALHELATNAAKHGALTRAKGRVSVEWRWREPEDGGIEIVWSERGGPKVAAADHRGFGSLVIQHSLSRALGANVEMAFLPEGLRCRVVVPRMHISVAATGGEPPRTIRR